MNILFILEYFFISILMNQKEIVNNYVDKKKGYFLYY